MDCKTKRIAVCCCCQSFLGSMCVSGPTPLLTGLSRRVTAGGFGEPHPFGDRSNPKCNLEKAGRWSLPSPCPLAPIAAVPFTPQRRSSQISTRLNRLTIRFRCRIRLVTRCHKPCGGNRRRHGGKLIGIWGLADGPMCIPRGRLRCEGVEGCSVSLR